MMAADIEDACGTGTARGADQISSDAIPLILIERDVERAVLRWRLGRQASPHDLPRAGLRRLGRLGPLGRHGHAYESTGAVEVTCDQRAGSSITPNRSSVPPSITTSGAKRSR